MTGAMAALGLVEPALDDLVFGLPDNPNHHESRSIMTTNDRMLRALGGSWSAPPPLGTVWEDCPALHALEGDAAAAAAFAYRERGARVWKDPRAALLLPFWRRVLPGPLPAVLVWRRPLAVARSLCRRDGLTLTHGLALWDWYNRAAMAALAGHDVLVVRYDELVEDPKDVVVEIAEWLDGLAISPPGGSWDVDAAAAVVSPDLDHEGAEGDVPSDQLDLVGLLGELRGAHAPFAPPGALDPPPWVSEYITERRCREMALAAADEAHRHLTAWTDECDRLAAELDRWRQECKRLSAELAHKSAACERLSAELTWRSEAHELLEAELAGRSAECERLSAELDHRSQEYHRLAADLDALRRPWTRRWSAPLRSASRLMRTTGAARLRRAAVSSTTVPSKA